MGKSFIIKDQSGKPSGYLLQELRTIRCRFSGAEAGMEVFLLYADGRHSAKQIEPLREEQEWEGDGSALEGAVVVKDGAMIASSGRQAGERFRNMQATAQRRKTAERAQASSGEKAQEQQTPMPEDKNAKKEEKQIDGRKNSFPERRWPPPPCWQNAVYEHGRWTDEGKSEK